MLPDMIFMNNGYKKIIAEHSFAEAYFCVVQGVCQVVLEVDYRDTRAITRPQLDSYAYSLVNFLYGQGYSDIVILFIIDTYSEYIASELMDDYADYWVYDTYKNRLVVAECRRGDFNGLYNTIKYYVEHGTVLPQKDERLYGEDGQKHALRMNYLIILLNVMVYIWLEINGSTTDVIYMLEHGGLYWPCIAEAGQWYRLISSMFMHFGASHLFNNMFVLFFTGGNLEKSIGKLRYLFLYVGSGVVSNLISCIYYEVRGMTVVSCGASGAIFGVVGALLYIIIVNKGRYCDLTIRRMLLFIVMSIYSGMVSPNVNLMAHLSGLAAGFIMAVILYRQKEGKR